MRKMLRKGRVVLGLTLALVAGGVAFAAWTANGTGTGYAKATTAQALSTVDVSGTTAATLYPGNSDGDVLVKFSNPNPYPVQITSITDSGAITTVSDDATCDASTGVTFEDQAGTWSVPAASGTTAGVAEFTLTGAANMSNASANACQGEIFDIPLTFSGASNA